MNKNNKILTDTQHLILTPEATDHVKNLFKLNTVDAIKLGFCNHLKYTLAKDQYTATAHDKFYALAMTVRDRLIQRWMETSQLYHRQNVKRVYYLSMEYLIGRLMGNNILNLGLNKEVSNAMEDLGINLQEARDQENDAGLGNGGLGRLAACFLDSLATLEYPGYGYGVRYDYGIFQQLIRNGYQLEKPDNWLRNGNPWEIERPEYQIPVRFGGNIKESIDENGNYTAIWENFETVIGMPYDVPIAGYGNNTVNNLRLWSAKATEEFDLQFFNNGDYIKAYAKKTLSENITKVLYPSDHIRKGKELRLKQQYFFVACSLHDIVRRFKKENGNQFKIFPEKVSIQLNDTHPSLGVAELMRIFLDIEKLEWDEAWDIITRTFSYTNHTLLPEALERWSIELFQEILPRHLTIIYEINRRFLRQVMNKYPNDEARLARMSLIEEGPIKYIRMAYLSIVGSHKVNGVAELHSQLLKDQLFKDFYELTPEKFTNMTNGITQRRWLAKSNPELANIITNKIGDKWITNLEELKKLTKFTKDKKFLAQIQEVKQQNKNNLAKHIKKTTNITIDPTSIFDVQVKRLHEYKRQLLNVMHILHRYNQLKQNPELDLVPRTFIFGAKAAPGYTMAKLIIKLINDISCIINNDPTVNKKLKVVFLEDYKVSLAEKIIPASDLSEQISTAGKEASGTGNMKFALNGALTIGTLDGANVEIRQEVGEKNFFLFGHTVESIEKIRYSYNPWDYYEKYPELKAILDLFKSNFLNLEEPRIYIPIWDTLLTYGDQYFHLADFHSYIEMQEKVDQTYKDQNKWTQMALMNIANSGKFSSDRTIKQYATQIWNIKPCHITLPI